MTCRSALELSCGNPQAGFPRPMARPAQGFNERKKRKDKEKEKAGGGLERQKKEEAAAAARWEKVGRG